MSKRNLFYRGKTFKFLTLFVECLLKCNEENNVAEEGTYILGKGVRNNFFYLVQNLLNMIRYELILNQGK